MSKKEAIKQLSNKAGIKPKKEKKKALSQELYQLKKSFNDFLIEHPVFYDEHSLWWVWNDEGSFWEIKDAVDVLNKFIDYSGLSTEKVSGNAQFIIKVLQQKSRRHKPEELPSFCIQFSDTIVSLKDKKEFKATPKYFSTSPIPYNLSKKSETPTIDKLFEDWAGVEYKETLYEILSYSCLREQFLQTFIALTGAGSNGKGTYQNLLIKFLGDKNCVSSSIKSLITRSFETSAMYKKLLCLIGEVDSSDLNNTNLIKQLTGEDLIRYEFKGKTCFSEKSPTTFIIATNSLPRTPDKSDGFYRRSFVIDFPNQFKVTRDLLAKIPEVEFENLTRRVVNCLHKLLKTNEFTNGGSIEERRKRYEERSNPLMMFISEKYVEGGVGYVKLREFANNFNQFLKERKLRQETISRIGKLLRDEGFEISTRKFKNKKDEVIDSAKSIIGLSEKSDLLGIEKSGGSGGSDEEQKPPEPPESPIPAKKFKCFRCGKTIEKSDNLKIGDRYYCDGCFKIMEGLNSGTSEEGVVRVVK